MDHENLRLRERRPWRRPNFWRSTPSSTMKNQDHSRWTGLAFKQAVRPWVLTDEEKQELAELERRYPPDPNDPFKSTFDAIKEALAEEERRTSR